MKKFMLILSLVVVFLGYVGNELGRASNYYDCLAIVGMTIGMLLLTGLLHGWKANPFSASFGFMLAVLAVMMYGSFLFQEIWSSGGQTETNSVLMVTMTLIVFVGAGCLVVFVAYISTITLEERVFRFSYESKFLMAMLLVASAGMTLAMTLSLVAIPVTIAVLAYMAVRQAPKYATGFGW